MSLTLIDARTALLMVAALYVVLPLSTWYALARQQTPAVTLWCSGGLLAAAGLALIGARDAIPAILSFHLGNALLVLCLLLWCQAFRLDLDRPWSIRFMIGVVLAFLLTYALFYEWTTPVVRGTFSKIVLCILVSHVTWLASRIARTERSLNAYALTCAYGALSLSFGIQIVLAVVGPDTDPSPFKDSVDAVIVALSAMIAAVVGNFSYVGMTLDRSLNKQIAELAERARLAESIRLSDQITALDRDRSISLMAAALGHELNQPLTAALTNAQVAQMSLRADRYDVDTLRGFLDRVGFNTERASRILDRTRSMVMGKTPALSPVELIKLVRINLAALNDYLKGFSIDVNDTMGAEPCWVNGDEVQLSQVLSNVLRNAIESMSQSPQRRLSVSLTVHGGMAHLYIRDSGTGLALENEGASTQAFVTTKADGLGVGLSIARAILDHHHGSLRLDKTDDGQGTQADITLPLAHDRGWT